MKTAGTALLLVSLAALASTQSMPACAENCLGQYLPQSTCNATDVACICADVSLMGSVQACTLGSCTVKESLTAKNATATLCGEPVRDITPITPIVTAVSGSVAILCVLLRLADRIPYWRSLQWADLCVVISLLFAIPMGVLEFIMSVDGFGRDIWTIPFDNITRVVQLTWLTEIFYMCVVGFTKLAILLLYWRVFPTKPFRHWVLGSIIVGAAYIPAFALAIAFHCTPVSYGWTFWTGETHGHCFNVNAYAWAHAIINIVFDLWVILLPVPMLLRLNLGRRKKIHLMLMFSVGFFITVVSVIRLRSLVRFANTTNATYDNVPTAYWSVLEAFVSIICTCLPAMRSLMRRLFPTCFGSSADPDSNGINYRISSPMHSADHKKSYTHNATVNSGSDHSDILELVQNEEQETGRSAWSR